MMKIWFNLWSFLVGSSVDTISAAHRTAFWREIIFSNIRRIRSLLVVSVCANFVLIYVVNIQDAFVLPSEDNRLVLIVHLGLLVLHVTFLVLAFYRFPRVPENVRRYHVTVLRWLFVAFVAGSQSFIFTIFKVKGHPIFAFLTIIVWGSSIIMPPRLLAAMLVLMMTGLWTLMVWFAQPTDNVRFRAEAYMASLIISLVLVATGSLLFRTTVEAFRQRKIVEEERNVIRELHAETDAMNQELQRRQEMLEAQATDIEIMNTTLQEQNEMLKSLNTEKNELMGIVAHDLKNPIGAIRGFAELMHGGFVPHDDVRDVAEKIVHTSERMLGLVTNLLDINRLESGAAQFHIVECSVLPIVAAVLEQYRTAADAKNITLSLHHDATVERAFLHADEQALLQIVDNLVSNAVKYSPKNSSVDVRLRVVRAGEILNKPAKNDGVRIEVQDEGPGLTHEDKPKLFGKFARLSARPTGGEHSTGLGLSIVKKMAEAMQGEVWCESEPGKGAIFIVEFPLSNL